MCGQHPVVTFSPIFWGDVIHRGNENNLVHPDAAPFDVLNPTSSESSSTMIGAAMLRLGAVRGIWRQGWVVAAGVVTCGIIAFVYLFFATPLYTSTSRIYVEPASSSKATAAAGAS